MSNLIECRFCGEKGPVGSILPGLCPVGRGGVHEPHDMFGPIPPKPPVDPEVSEAARKMNARRRGALSDGLARAKLAGDKQEKVAPGWYTAAAEHVIHFGRSRGEKGFLLEEAAAFAYAHGLPQPQERRAWGTLPQQLKKEPDGRRLEHTGTYDIDNFGSPKARWRIV